MHISALYLLEQSPELFLDEGFGSPFSFLRSTMSKSIFELGGKLSTYGIKTRTIISEVRKEASNSSKKVKINLEKGNDIKSQEEIKNTFNKLWEKLKEKTKVESFGDAVVLLLYGFVLILLLFFLIYYLSKIESLFGYIIILTLFISAISGIILSAIRAKKKLGELNDNDLNPAVEIVSSKIGVNNSRLTKVLSKGGNLGLNYIKDGIKTGSELKAKGKGSSILAMIVTVGFDLLKNQK